MSSTSTSQGSGKVGKKGLVAILVLAVMGVGLLIPPLVYGGLMVPVSTITFGETTGSLTTTTAQVKVESKTAYEYMLTTRSGGMVRTTETDVSTSRGTANITMRLELTNPSGQMVDLGNVNITGGMGTRNHTLYLGVDEGVRVPGSYKLDIIITVSVAPVGGLLELNLTTTVTVNFTVS